MAKNPSSLTQNQARDLLDMSVPEATKKGLLRPGLKTGTFSLTTIGQARVESVASRPGLLGKTAAPDEFDVEKAMRAEADNRGVRATVGEQRRRAAQKALPAQSEILNERARARKASAQAKAGGTTVPSSGKVIEAPGIVRAKEVGAVGKAKGLLNAKNLTRLGGGIAGGVIAAQLIDLAAQLVGERRAAGAERLQSGFMFEEALGLAGTRAGAEAESRSLKSMEASATISQSLATDEQARMQAELRYLVGAEAEAVQRIAATRSPSLADILTGA